MFLTLWIPVRYLGVCLVIHVWVGICTCNYEHCTASCNTLGSGVSNLQPVGLWINPTCCRGHVLALAPHRGISPECGLHGAPCWTGSMHWLWGCSGLGCARVSVQGLAGTCPVLAPYAMCCTRGWSSSVHSMHQPCSGAHSV